ncbi:AraC family ligand binding domain-containing protein [Oleiharenicola sp. Vm1]|uniref:AraC family ligand binding domain-containing protein n=1 Tax=Oleiharenicola sp. Vm1 TaxID=3398393 RepID=UPI0039F62CE1
MPHSAKPDLSKLVSKLPQPNFQLLGRRPAPLPLPANIVCFQRQRADELNKPRRGRALHHRFVLICALRTAVTVCVDDRNLRLSPGEALLVFPFQFHHYTQPQRPEISWLFVTFELNDAEPLAALRYRPFALTPALRTLVAELVEGYETERTEELPVLLLALLLARMRRIKHPAPHHAPRRRPSRTRA